MNMMPFTHRQSIVKVCVVGMLGLAVLVGSSSVSLARQKKLCEPVAKDVFGCTNCDLQSSDATKCIEQGIRDLSIFTNVAHVVMCGPGGKKCCLIETKSNKVISCKSITNVTPSINPGVVTPPVLPGTVAPGDPALSTSPTGTLGGVIQRGVEGAPAEKEGNAPAPK